MTHATHDKIAGVIGWPVDHSLSPDLHGYWLREFEIAGAYVRLAVAREDFSVSLRGLERSGFVGVNVTVPHKEAAFALAHDLDEIAASAGAVNLLLFENGRYVGRNTDVEGLAASVGASLGAAFVNGATVTVLGTGGAARAAVLAAERLHAGEVVVLGRQAARADALVNALRPGIRARVIARTFEDWPQTAAQTQLLVNATSAGMKTNAPLGLDLDPLPGSAGVCDLVYNPLDTALLSAARARGLRTVDGLGMLMHQGVSSFEAFYGVRPAVTFALRLGLEETLNRAG